MNTDGLPPEIGGRLRKWADLGSEFDIGGDRMVEAVRVAGSPGTPAWVSTMTDIGDEVRARADGIAAGSDPLEARNRFLEASFWYFVARFPHVLSPAAAEAYDKHISAYLAAARYFEPPLEVVQVPFEGGSYPAYLRLPRQRGDRSPVVVLWGGMDVWKSELEMHLQTEQLLERGVATLVIDMPGTGQSPIPVSDNAERVPTAAIDFLRQHPAIDARRIAVWGLSFGGYFAVKLALVCPELSGAVNNGGPIHHAYATERFHQLPTGARITLARVLGLEPSTDPDSVADRLTKLSLVEQNLLPADRHAPLLSINGELDQLIPISDLYVIGEYGVRQDRMIYGEDIHVAGRNWRHHYPMTASWLAAKLARTAH